MYGKAGYSLTTKSDEQVRRESPRLHQELDEAARKEFQENNDVYKTYKSKTCLVCTRARQIPFSRYCNQHYKFFENKRREDGRSHKARHPNYGYTLPGWNEGLNAWITDKDHYRQLAQLAQSEGLRHTEYDL